jgi:hypothetical protein
MRHARIVETRNTVNILIGNTHRKGLPGRPAYLEAFAL